MDFYFPLVHQWIGYIHTAMQWLNHSTQVNLGRQRKILLITSTIEDFLSFLSKIVVKKEKVQGLNMKREKSVLYWRRTQTIISCDDDEKVGMYSCVALLTGVSYSKHQSPVHNAGHIRRKIPQMIFTIIFIMIISKSSIMISMITTIILISASITRA